MKYLNKALLWVSLSIMMGTQLLGQEKQELTIEISNIKSIKGSMMLAIYDSADTFLGRQVVKGLTIPVTQKGKMQFVVKDLPLGTYAFSIYHDENDNRVLDTNLMRFPREPYGFSNKAKGRFGPPSFKRAKIRFETNAQVVDIALK